MIHNNSTFLYVFVQLAGLSCTLVIYELSLLSIISEAFVSYKNQRENQLKKIISSEVDR